MNQRGEAGEVPSSIAYVITANMSLKVVFFSFYLLEGQDVILAEVNNQSR